MAYRETGRIELHEIGRPREADIMFRNICRNVGYLAIEGDPLPADRDLCISSTHGPFTSRRWESKERIGRTMTPRLVVLEFNDPCIAGQWGVDLEADPLPNGTPTVDSYYLTTDGLTLNVESKILDGQHSAVYYQGIIEMGTVYSLELAEADTVRLSKLEHALIAAVETVDNE